MSRPDVHGHGSSAPPSGAMHGSRPHRPHIRPLWSLGLFFLFVVASLLAVSSVPLDGLGIPEAIEHVGEEGQGPDGQENQEHDGDTAKEQEQGFGAPRLRDVSEYVLDPSWDAAAPPTTRAYNWTILDARLNPDGVYRPMILINNQFPGPLVECNEGDTLLVRVHNRAANATSIHFHGLFQNGTNAMDGAVGITQCPIAPGSSFVYEFSARGQSGTYWYHAHHSAQASDGLLGPVVIHPRPSSSSSSSSSEEGEGDDLGYASDRIVMLQDHYHNLTSELLMDYLRPDAENAEPVPDNALINGRGARDCADFPGWQCDSSSPPLPEMHLAPGRRHRLRFINVGAFAEFQVQLDQHPFYVVEVDGVDVHPEPFHRLNILPAQRYSIVLEANVTSASAFWMRARMVTHCFASKNPRLQPEARAIIRYAPDSAVSHGSSISQDPSSVEWPDPIEVVCRDLNTTLLRPVVPQPPPPADRWLALTANFMIRDWRLSRGYFNDSSWRANLTHPSLHRFLDSSASSSISSNLSVSTSRPPSTNLSTSGSFTGDTSLAINEEVFNPSHELVLQSQGIVTVDMAINNFDDGAHPFHLHGHKFHILANGRSGYPPPPSSFSKPHPNPLRRDVLTVEGYGWAVVRVVLDNPGLWAFHCHNLWHAEAGMLMQFLVRADVVRHWEVGAEQRGMCALEGVEKGARPSDDIWFGHFA